VAWYARSAAALRGERLRAPRGERLRAPAQLGAVGPSTAAAPDMAAVGRRTERRREPLLELIGLACYK